MTETNNECPVCFESYICPKLLPCAHTFCYKCIKHCAYESEGRFLLKCPLCRAMCDNTEDGLLTNYFTAMKKIPDVCEYCSDISRIVDKICKECNMFCCSVCLNGHCHVSNHEEDKISPIPKISDLVGTFGFVRTKFICGHYNTITPDYPNGEDVSKKVNCIYTTEEYVYVVVEGNTKIYKYNTCGKLISIICTPSVAFGLIERKDGSLLAAFPQQMVLAYSYGAWRKFLKISYDPVNLAETPEETVIICGQLEKNIRNRNFSYGTVEIFSKHGHLLKTICVNDNNEFLFRTVRCIAVNPNIGSFAVCSADEITIFKSNGDIYSVFKGSNPLTLSFVLDRTMRNAFKPIDICCDSEGNFLVSEETGGYVHVLNPQGKFVGVLTGKQSSGGGLPGCLAVDNKGYIWIEDIQNKCIKVFKYSFYENYF